MYQSHPIHTGKSYLFLQNPLNKTNGRIKIGIITETIFASLIALPNNRPREFPAKEIKNRIKQKVKNCFAVLSRPIIQYMMHDQKNGIKISKGISTMLRDAKKVNVPYNLAPSSFKKTIFYLGNTIETGERAVIIPLMQRKNIRPVSVQKSTPAISSPDGN